MSPAFQDLFSSDGVDLGLLFGALFALLGVGLLWWGALALRDGEKRPGIVCTVFGVAFTAGAFSLFGVF